MKSFSQVSLILSKLVGARDLRTLWSPPDSLKRAEKNKKKKTLVLTLGSPPKKGGKKTLVLTLGSPPEKGGEKKKKTLVLTLGRSDAYTANPPEKGGKKNKKTLVLTLGRSDAYTANPPEKGGKKNKKTVVLTLGSPPEKGGEKKKKNPDINPGQPAGLRFQDLDLDFRTWSCPSVEVLKPRSAPGRTGQTDGQTPSSL